MYKLLLSLLLVLLTLADPGFAVAESEVGAITTTEATMDGRPVPRPNYKRYKGRKKHRKPGFFRRWAARRKAKRKMQTPPRKGVITVDPPTRNK